MNFFMKNTLKALCVIIGTIIGAGFASGREIYIFFNCYGSKGLAGIILSSTLTGLIIYQVLNQIKHKKIENYHQYIEKIGINASLKEIINNIINLFLLISFYIMVAGFSAYFKQQWGLSEILTGFIMIVLCYITFLHSMEGVTKVNTILIPILIAIIILLGIKNVSRKYTKYKYCKFKRKLDDS